MNLWINMILFLKNDIKRRIDFLFIMNGFIRYQEIVFACAAKQQCPTVEHSSGNNFTYQFLCMFKNIKRNQRNKNEDALHKMNATCTE
jgi:hypothetical protein